MNKSTEKMLFFYAIEDKKEDVLAMLSGYERKYRLA